MPTGTNIGYNEVLSTKILTRYTTRTGVQWIIIEYNGKLLAKILSLNYKIAANLDHQIDYIVIIINFLRRNLIH